MKNKILLLTLVIIFALTFNILAQDVLPSGAIQVIVPWSAGGGTDTVTRYITRELEERLDHAFAVINATGGGGTVGFSRIANADPNGKTIGMISSSLLLTQYTTNAGIDYTNYTPITQVNFDSAALSVNADSDFETLEDFISYAKENSVRISNSGPGAIWHLSAAAFAKETNTNIEHIPYEGGNPAAVAVAGGHVDATTVSVPEVAPLVDSGKLRILAVFSDERHSDFPDVPTLKEKDIDLVLGVWRGIVAPKGVPTEIIDLIDKETREIVNSEAFREFMKNNGYGVVVRDSSEFSDFMKTQDEALKDLIFELDLNA